MKIVIFCGILAAAGAGNIVCAQPTDSSRGSSPLDCKIMARTAVNDLLRQFWTGDAENGHLVNTYGGITPPKYEPCGVLWERAQFLCLLENYWELSQDKAILRRIQSDWHYVRTAFTHAELVSCGRGSKNWASDDAAWSTWMYLKVYQATGDPESLACAKDLANATFCRWRDREDSNHGIHGSPRIGQRGESDSWFNWQDPHPCPSVISVVNFDFGGGLWYDDGRQAKGLYLAANALGFLKLYEITHDRGHLNHAMLCYDWMEEKLLRPDGLYWMGYTATGPQGANNPYGYGEAGSCVYLGGAMAMGVIHARLFKITGNDMFRIRALRTAKALRTFLVDANGVFIDDRDAWNNGLFCGDWAREVLTLPGVEPLDIKAVKDTAAAIFTKDRTEAGLLGPCWDGPITEPNPWSRSKTASSNPKQIMTSASAASMIVGAASVP